MKYRFWINKKSNVCFSALNLLPLDLLKNIFFDIFQAGGNARDYNETGIRAF